MKWFTADTHFGHDSIINYTNRPFKNSNVMTNVLTENINSMVAPDDDLYILGDFSLTHNDKTLRRYVNNLNGYKHLILGNHDHFRATAYVNMGFETVHTTLELDDGMNCYMLTHDPAVACGERYKHHRWLCGHVHTLFTFLDDETPNVLNVGMDVHKFHPLSFDDVKSYFN